MKTIIKLAFILLTVGVVVMVPARANLLTNGSFEDGVDPGTDPGFLQINNGDNTSITGWTVDGDSVDYVGPYWQASDGVRSLDLNGADAGGIEQTFATTPGQQYLVTFDLAGNPAGPPSDKTVVTTAGLITNEFDFDVSIAGSTLINMNWVQKSFIFTADASTTTLSFISTTQDTPYGPALDNVVVTAAPTPEPSSFVLVAGGVLSLFFAARVRRSRVTA